MPGKPVTQLRCPLCGTVSGIAYMTGRIQRAVLGTWVICVRTMGGRGKISAPSEHKTLIEVVRANQENPFGGPVARAGSWLRHGVLCLFQQLHLAGLITPTDLDLCGIITTFERLAALLNIKTTPGPSGYAPPRPVTAGAVVDAAAYLGPDKRLGYAPARPVTMKEVNLDA